MRVSLGLKLSLLVASLITLASINLVLDYISIQELRSTALSKMNQTMLTQHKQKLKALSASIGIVLENGLARLPKGEKRLAYVRRVLNPIRFFENKSGYFFVFRQDGLRVALPPFPKLVGTNALNDDALVFRLLLQKARAGGGFRQWKWHKPGKLGKQPKLGYVAPIKGTKMFLCTGVYIDDIEEKKQQVAVQFDRSSRYLFLRATALFIISLLVFLLFVWTFLRNSILRPIQRMSQAAEQVRQGHFDVDLGVEANDEMGQLVRSFREMIKARKNAEHAQKMESIGRLAGGVAHDFNNLLGGILGAAQLLTEAIPEEDELHAHAALIARAALSAAEFTRQLLAFSRNSPMARKQVDLHDSIINVSQLLQHTVDRRIKIEVITEATSSVVFADAAQVQRMLLNLGLNACDAMSEGGEVLFHTQDRTIEAPVPAKLGNKLTPGKFIELSVEDQGKGMNLDTIQHIFDPFFTTKDVGEGTGLGLSVVYGVVQEHGGAIQVVSEPGTGSRFSILLPVMEPDLAPALSSPPKKHTRKGRILVIDDEPVIQALFRNILTTHGHDIVLAGDGAEGLKQFQETDLPFDVVLLDVLMPVMGGEEVFPRLQAIDPNVKVIFMSGFSRETTVDELLAAGAIAFLQKPFELQELRDALALALDETASRDH